MKKEIMKNIIEELEKERMIYLRDNLNKIKDAQSKKDILLACELLVKYAEYESGFNRKIRDMNLGNN